LRLLRQWPPAQRAQFAEKGYFEVVGGDTGKLYRIYAGAATNVCEVDENGRPTLGLCFLPMGDPPIGDVMLSQKIALESSESRAHGVARRFAPDGTFRHGRLLPSRLISRKLTPVTNRGRRDRRSTGIPETVLLRTGTG
jgi:hypothetical protein